MSGSGLCCADCEATAGGMDARCQDCESRSTGVSSYDIHLRRNLDSRLVH